MRSLSIVVALACAACVHREAAPGPVTGSTRQLLVVVSDAWPATSAELRRFERGASGWTSVGSATRIVLGRSGLGWGRGLHGAGAPAGRSGPLKAEGDGRAPAGVFSLSQVLGYAPAPPDGARGAYLQATPTVLCVDDPASRAYNQLVDSATTPADWSSVETMRRDDELYRWVVVVDHNTKPPSPGAGSCIFLHIWRGEGSVTAGCTAMEAGALEELIRWLQPEQAAYVALPREEYAALSEAWSLPPLP